MCVSLYDVQVKWRQSFIYLFSFIHLIRTSGKFELLFSRLFYRERRRRRGKIVWVLQSSGTCASLILLHVHVQFYILHTHLGAMYMKSDDEFSNKQDTSSTRAPYTIITINPFRCNLVLFSSSIQAYMFYNTTTNSQVFSSI